MRRYQELLLLTAVFVWCGTVIYFYRSQDSMSVRSESQLELDKVSIAIDQLQKQNSQLLHIVDMIDLVKIRDDNTTEKDLRETMRKLKKQLEKCRSSRSSRTASVGGNVEAPSKEHEVLMKKIENGVVELGYSIETELELLKKQAQGETETSLSRLSTQQRSILIDIEDLNKLTSAWKEQEAKDLQDIVKRRIDYIQNPKDCPRARQLVCKLNKGCGFGCQVHHLVYCALIAFGTNRTLVVESQNWRYNANGWEAVFQPVSQTCTKASASAVQWKGEEGNKHDQVVVLPIVDGLPHRPPYLPLGIPEDLAPHLLRIHGNPSVWWVGQFMRFVMRPQDWLQKDLNDSEQKLRFKKPIVGIQVRRTDKVGTEAAFHSIEEYMKYVHIWYDKYELRASKERSGEETVRRVYIASDDPTVLPEAQKKYPDYKFISDVSISQSASLNSRYTKESLRGVIVDIHFLSKCDYLVCTFSSQVCRVAYELMQTLHPDASSYFHSLDDVYYYGGQTAHDQVAIYEHVASRPEEIDLKVGDVVGIAGNHWDGYSKGTNHRTGRVGLYPSYKVIESYRLVKYPTYPEAGAIR